MQKDKLMKEAAVGDKVNEKLQSSKKVLKNLTGKKYHVEPDNTFIIIN